MRVTAYIRKEGGAMRLDKYLHDLGFGSRKEINRLLVRRQLCVDGVRVTKGAAQVSVQSAVTLDGEALVYAPTVWLLLNTPDGVITAATDARQETVMDLLPERYARMGVTPVGRLDKDTTGLLLLTNDGALAHFLLSPKRHVEKVYDVHYTGTLAADAVQQVAAGIDLGDFTTAPALLEMNEAGRCRLTLREGKFHQVKRMIHALGGEVTALARTHFGGVALDPSLALGEWRALTDEEVALLGAQVEKERTMR